MCPRRHALFPRRAESPDQITRTAQRLHMGIVSLGQELPGSSIIRTILQITKDICTSVHRHPKFLLKNRPFNRVQRQLSPPVALATHSRSVLHDAPRPPLILQACPSLKNRQNSPTIIYLFNIASAVETAVPRGSVLHHLHHREQASMPLFVCYMLRTPQDTPISRDTCTLTAHPATCTRQALPPHRNSSAKDHHHPWRVALQHVLVILALLMLHCSRCRAHQCKKRKKAQNVLNCIVFCVCFLLFFSSL